MILVVGATGQIGSLVVRRLLALGHPTVALVRSHRQAEDLAELGAGIVVGDLRNPADLAGVLPKVRCIVATANVVAPTSPGDTEDSLARGYQDLIERAERAGVGRFVYASVPVTPLDDQVPTLRTKRLVERSLASSGLSSISVRLTPFTEVWLALIGSALPLRGEHRATVNRPYHFLRTYRTVAGTTIDKYGVLALPGPRWHRNAFISVHDVARVLVAAIDATDLPPEVDVGGPEVLSWQEVARLFADILGRPVRIVSTPGAVFAVLQQVLAPWARSASSLMAMNRLLASMETNFDSSDVTKSLGVAPLRSVADVLREKAAMTG